eukprot:GHUV01037280.1.p1 GENE.GHUV01037280.1~~GHUV01037280.1.p1  ORF type:complete len:235 (+),score=59.40 GHUV01037280.1:254-958(+)
MLMLPAAGLRSSDASEEVCITFSNALIRINTLDLRSLIRMLQYTQHGNYSAAATVPPLAHLRYEFPAAVGPRVCGLSFGTVSNDLYSLLSSGSSSSAAREPKQQGRQKIAIVTVGKSPCLAAFEAEERPNKSTLAALVGMASSLAVGVAGAASKAAGLGPSLMYHGGYCVQCCHQARFVSAAAVPSLTAYLSTCVLSFFGSCASHTAPVSLIACLIRQIMLWCRLNDPLCELHT